MSSFELINFLHQLAVTSEDQQLMNSYKDHKREINEKIMNKNIEDKSHLKIKVKLYGL